MEFSPKMMDSDEMNEFRTPEMPDDRHAPNVPQNTPVIDYSYAIGDGMKHIYTPSLASRQTHNEKERRRRSRMKYSCDMLRALVPDINEKTDKATVLEHTVNYLIQLQRCVNANDQQYNDVTQYEQLKLLEAQMQEMDTPNDSHVMEVQQLLTTADGMQYMIIDAPQMHGQKLIDENWFEPPQEESGVQEIHVHVFKADDETLEKGRSTEEIGTDKENVDANETADCSSMETPKLKRRRIGTRKAFQPKYK